jgi:hypothetical protein
LLEAIQTADIYSCRCEPPLILFPNDVGDPFRRFFGSFGNVIIFLGHHQQQQQQQPTLYNNSRSFASTPFSAENGTIWSLLLLLLLFKIRNSFHK